MNTDGIDLNFLTTELEGQSDSLLQKVPAHYILNSGEKPF